MKVAVTGAGGFIGNHLVRHLHEVGHDVVPLGRDQLAPSAEGQPGASHEEVTAALSRRLLGVEAVLHLAARSQESPEDPLAVYLGPNVALTESVLLAAVGAGVQHVLLASTRLAYPPNAVRPSDETDDGRPATLYGLSKRIAEDLAQHYAGRAGLAATSLRLGQVFGPGDRGRGVLPRFIQEAAAGRDLEVVGKGVAVRDFVYVGDVVRAFELALTSSPRSQIINIGGGGHSVRELAETVAAAAPVGKVGVVYRPTANEDTTVYSMDCSRAAEELGWQARPLAATVAEAVDRAR